MKMDWSEVGCGYVLYAWDHSEGIVIGLNSKREQEISSSYLGELPGFVLGLAKHQ